MGTVTIVLKTALVTKVVEDVTGQSEIDVPDGPAAWVDAFSINGDRWIAGIGADAVTFLDLTPGQQPTRTLIGTATQGAFDAFKTFHGDDCYDGEEAAADGQIRGFLRARTKADGGRLVPTLRLTGQSVDISVVSPHVVAGHDRIEAALPDGLTADDVDVDLS